MARKRSPAKSTAAPEPVVAPNARRPARGEPKPPVKPAKLPVKPAKLPVKPAKVSPAAKPAPAKKAPPPKALLAKKAPAKKAPPIAEAAPEPAKSQSMMTVRHMARRDINRVWDFLKISFREVNAETVEYQRPRSKHRFEEVYEEEGIEQLVFEIDGEIVAYAECSYEVTGSDNWINPRYFEKRDMRPLFVDELAVHPEVHGRGVGSFVLEQLHHLARVHGLNHLVLEVAENNERALDFYRRRAFKKLDAAIFMACAVQIEPELLPPRELPAPRVAESDEHGDGDK